MSISKCDLTLFCQQFVFTFKLRHYLYCKKDGLIPRKVIICSYEPDYLPAQMLHNALESNSKYTDISCNFVRVEPLLLNPAIFALPARCWCFALPIYNVIAVVGVRYPLKRFPRAVRLCRPSVFIVINYPVNTDVIAFVGFVNIAWH